MIPTQIEANVVRLDTPAVYAYYIIWTTQLFPLALVCNEDDMLIGVIGKSEIDPYFIDIRTKTCGDICNRNFSYLKSAEKLHLYKEARNIMAEKPRIMVLPILNNDCVLVGMIAKWQAFFMDMYKKLAYSYYAQGLIQATLLAKSRGYDEFSAIEFGVAAGKGLLHLELFAQCVSALYKIKIYCYGFDSGKGLFAPADFRDNPEYWVEGDYNMDIDSLQKKLYQAKLVIGNISETSKTFLESFSPAPIGFISVDVDQYTPTCAILDMLLQDNKYFLPIVPIYFDDVSDSNEFQGENLAIKEFNAKSDFVKISPEGLDMDRYIFNETTTLRGIVRLKTIKFFNHPNLATNRKITNISCLV